ncbi:hypothetical protein ACP70R_032142 [Stipagrostis hirtigluma subsp. patula]
MGSTPAAGDEDDGDWCIVGYDGVETSSTAGPVEPVPAHGIAAQPGRSGVGGGMAAHEDDDDDDMVFPPAGPEAIMGCGNRDMARDEASPAPDFDPVSPAAVAGHDAAPAAQGNWVVAAPPLGPPAGGSNGQGAHGAAGVEVNDDDEVTDEDEDDGLYDSYYDLADHGRARRVKRSSGRRGRTKKASTIGRPRCEERMSRVAAVL